MHATVPGFSDARLFSHPSDIGPAETMAPLDTIKQFIVQHVGDERLIARRILLALYRREVAADQAGEVLKYLFRLTHFITVFEYLLVYLVATRGPLPDPRHITNSPRAQALYRPFGLWLRQCFVEDNPSMPPVNETQGMVFVDAVLDGAEAHLVSLRASVAAGTVAELRRKIEERWRNAASRWVLSSTFSSNIGHLVYAATLKTLRDGGDLPAPPIVMLRGVTRNPTLRGYFERDMAPDMPGGVLYAEMISARKRHTVASGRAETMSRLVSVAATRWTGGDPFLRADGELEARGAAELAKLGIDADRPIVTLHVREQGYNDNVANIMRLRDAHIASYVPAVRELVGAGYTVVRLGDATMSPVTAVDGLIDYPFTGSKSDWMDVYLAGRCAFHIGTSSGMSFVPLLFGRPVLFTNWPTLAHMVCAPSVITIPKILRTLEGQVVPFETFYNEHGEILEASDAILHGLAFDDNDPPDIRDAAMMMVKHLEQETGRMIFPQGLFDRAAAIAAGSPIGNAPQIPDWFLDRHYGAGTKAPLRPSRAGGTTA